MKRSYNSPVFDVEVFSANEYVAACYYVACDVTAANNVEDTVYGTYSENPTGLQVNHGTAGCGTASHQVISDDGSFYEISSDQGKMPCTITGGGFSSGYVYWNTYAADGRVWHHQGSVGAVDSAHPNRS